MHNPFGLLTMPLLKALIHSGHTHFVRQTYPRGLSSGETGLRAAFLVTHYNNVNRAQVHYEALTADPNRFLYDISKPEHYKKLETAAQQPLGFRVYSPLLEKPWKPPEMMAEKIRRYIRTQLQWSPGRSESVKAELFTQFGELFITLKHKTQQVKVPLGEIENY